MSVYTLRDNACASCNLSLSSRPIGRLRTRRDVSPGKLHTRNNIIIVRGNRLGKGRGGERRARGDCCRRRHRYLRRNVYPLLTRVYRSPIVVKVIRRTIVAGDRREIGNRDDTVLLCTFLHFHPPAGSGSIVVVGGVECRRVVFAHTHQCTTVYYCH